MKKKIKNSQFIKGQTGLPIVYLSIFIAEKILINLIINL